MISQANETSKQLMSALRQDRKSQMAGDLIRSIIFILLSVFLLGLFVKKKINAMILSISLIALSVFDLVGIDKRYLDFDKFREPEEVSDLFTPSPADVQILQDPDHANFRVFNQSPNFTNESLTSYHHNSVGGYSPAKLGLYQDLIEHQLGKGNMQVFNMLNTKYFITEDQTGKASAQMNPGAFGTCWLVKGIKYVNTPNEEMLALDNTNLRDTAVVAKAFQKSIKQDPLFDSTAVLQLKQRQNDAITYSIKAASPQFAVFSEVYYSAGWNAYLDGNKVDYVKTNYVLRGMYLPAGNHTIDFKFEPVSFQTGRTITIWSTALIYLAIVLAIVLYFKKKD